MSLFLFSLKPFLNSLFKLLCQEFTNFFAEVQYFISYVQIFEEELTRRPSFLLGDTLRSFVSPRRAILGLYFVFVLLC